MKELLENFALGPQKLCLFPILASQKLFPMTGDHSGLRLEVEVKLAYSQVSPWDQDEDKHLCCQTASVSSGQLSVWHAKSFALGNHIPLCISQNI